MASAVAWNRLFPEGAPEGAAAHRNKAKNCLVKFEDFAKQSFKVNHLYAKQALAIANYSPELLEAAKESLDGAYKTYQSEKLKREEDKRNRQLLVDHPDLKERVANGNLSAEEAIIIARKRDAEIIAKEESLKQQKAFIAQGFNRTIELFHGLLNWESNDILEAIENETLANAASQPKHEGESLLLAIKTMTEIHSRKYSK